MRSVDGQPRVLLRKGQSGFSLVELAIVLLVLGVLMRAAIQPLGARMEASQRSETKAQLEQVKAAMIGYLVLNGRLPCPGKETVGVDKPCSVIEGGINASLLGLPGEIDDTGLLLDVWGTTLRYRLASKQAWRARTSSESASGIPQTSVSIAEPGDRPLQICRAAALGNCRRQDVRADQLEYVVLSHGRDRSTSRLQLANLDGNAVFVKSPVSQVEGQEFDDELVWMSRSEMAYWLLRSGRTKF